MFIINNDTIREELHETSWAHDFERFKAITETNAEETGKKRPINKSDAEFVCRFVERMTNAMDFIESHLDDVNIYVKFKQMFTDMAISPADFEYGILGGIASGVLSFSGERAIDDNIEKIEHIASIGYIPVIEKIVSNEPYSIVYFADGSKTKVKCDGNDKFDPRTGIYLALLKKAMGSENLRHLFKLLSNAIPTDTDSEASDTKVNSEMKEFVNMEKLEENSPSDENEMPDGMESVNIDDLAEV